MRARLIVVTGTGTGLGKTHLACALVRYGRAREVAVGFKPIESGVTDESLSDANALLRASHPTFHVKHPCSPYLLQRPVSPHLAAAAEGRRIDPAVVWTSVARARADADALFVELAGGLFTPLGPRLTNAELAQKLEPDAVLLVAPDRLGVLHDVGAAVRAFAGITAVALVTPVEADASTGTNAAEIGVGTDAPRTVVSIPRAPVDELSRSRPLAHLYMALR